ncbi:hypothetical protein ACS0TY_032746 [Phlomoides rotata]
MAVCRHFHFEVSELVHAVYSTQTYASIYSSALFLPLADEEEWDETSFMLMHDPEHLIKRRGRDVTTRIHNEMDWAQTRQRQQYQARDRDGSSNQGSSSRRG